METQDHKSPIYSGNDGHGGVHVCRQCGWAFPNHHPSSKQRRAHKRVCGTVEGHKVLNNDALDETRVEGDVGEPISDDELKTASEKVVERTISRRSSSGVGSISNRSTRSEDDVFTDAGTELNESSSSLTRKASDGVMQRFYSMQNVNELDDTEPAEESSAATDNLLTPDLIKGNKLQTVQQVEAENDKLEAGVGPQDHISDSLVSAISLDSENVVDLNVVRSSEPSSMELDIVPKRDEGKGVSDEVLDFVSSDGLMKTTLVETDGVEDNNERFNAVGLSEKGKIESCDEVNSSGYLDSPVIQTQDVVSETKDTRKSDLTEEWDSKIDTNDNMYVLSVPDSKIAVGDHDHKEGKFNFPKDKDSMDVIGSDIDFTMIGDIDRVFCEDVDMPEDSTKFVEEHNAYQEPKQKSGANSSTVDINILRNEDDSKSKILEDQGTCTKENQPITSVVNLSPEGVAMDAGHIQEITSTGDFNVKDDEEHSTVLDKDGGLVSGNDFAVRNSMFAKPAVDDDTSQDLVLTNTSNNSGMDDIDNITIEADILNGEHTSEGVAKSMTTEIRPVSGLKVGESYDSIGYSKETDGIADQGAFNKISKSGDIVGHSQAESQLISECAGMIESTGEIDRKEERTDGNLIGGILINDNHFNSASNKLEVDEISENSCQSSAAANHCSNEKYTEKTLCASEGDGVNKQHVTIPAIDTIFDSSSQTDSLDVNWGSVSVMSTTSDAQPTADTIASNNHRALEGEETPSIVPRPVMENQSSENQISVKAEIGMEQIESVSEIQTSKEQHHINSALQTGWTPTVADVANEPDRGKKEEEIIAKVDNWDSGKQRSPLKTLLGEAIARSRAESPIHHNQTNVVPGINNRVSVKTENMIFNSDHPVTEASHEETGKEWDSPAKYPVKIKTEKRSKSKAYWAPFLCCSSVNAR